MLAQTAADFRRPAFVIPPPVVTLCFRWRQPLDAMFVHQIAAISGSHQMPSDIIALRSDTVTKPTAGMREAIFEADVGDDMSGEDPTVNRLEAMMAELLGKEAAVFNCSGTQSNQMAVRAHCQQGDEILIDETGHIVNYEQGAAAA